MVTPEHSSCSTLNKVDADDDEVSEYIIHVCGSNVSLQLVYYHG
jgi:hypothetical protein